MFKVTAIGNLGKDPEVTFDEKGDARCKFSIAPRQRKGKAGAAEKPTQWLNVVAFGKLGQLCGEHLKKGQQIYLEGDLEVREYTTKEGKHGTSNDVICRVMEFCGPPAGKGLPSDGVPF